MIFQQQAEITPQKGVDFQRFLNQNVDFLDGIFEFRKSRLLYKMFITSQKILCVEYTFVQVPPVQIFLKIDDIGTHSRRFCQNHIA